VLAAGCQRGIDSSESTTVLIDIPPIWMKPWIMPDSFSANLLHDLKSISREFAVNRQIEHGEVASAAFDLVFNFRFGSISQLKFPAEIHRRWKLAPFLCQSAGLVQSRSERDTAGEFQNPGAVQSILTISTMKYESHSRTRTIIARPAQVLSFSRELSVSRAVL
jgi:hypothetical protein